VSSYLLERPAVPLAAIDAPPAGSLFTYAEGETPVPFTPPGSVVTLDSLDPAGRAAAEEAARNAGLDPGTANFADAVLDFALTGETGFLAAALDGPAVARDMAVPVEPIEGGNAAPVAEDDRVETDRFVPLFSLDPAANDTDADGDALTVTAITQPSGGRAFLEDGALAYAPRPDFTGTDSFDYTVSDGAGGSDTARVSVEVRPLSDEIVTARTVAYLYEAGLDRAPDIAGVNFWIALVLEGEITEREASQYFLDAPEFTGLYGDVDTLTDRELVERLYLNTLDRPGEEAGIDFWVRALADPGIDRADMLLSFAESPENQLGSPAIATLAEGEDGLWTFPEL
jgi:hypothetical protein